MLKGPLQLYSFYLIKFDQLGVLVWNPTINQTFHRPHDYDHHHDHNHDYDHHHDRHNRESVVLGDCRQ